MKIKDIASIEPGLVTTRKKASIRFEVAKVYKVLTLNAVGEYGTIDGGQLSNFESVEVLSEHYFTKEGDILVRLNEPFTAIYIEEKDERILIPSYFVKLNINNKNFDPGYIAWYLNSEKVKREFLRSQSGTLIPSINQKVIREIDIPIRALEEQKDIINLYKLYKREVELMERLIEERAKLFNGITERLLK